MDTSNAVQYRCPSDIYLARLREAVVSGDFVEYEAPDAMFVNRDVFTAAAANDTPVAGMATLLTHAWRYICELLKEKDLLQAEVASVTNSKSALINRLVETVKSEGEERDYCADGMSEFIAQVLGMSQSDVLNHWFVATSNLRVVLDIEVEHSVGDYSAHDLLDLDEHSLAQWLEGTEANSLTVDVADIEWA